MGKHKIPMDTLREFRVLERKREVGSLQSWVGWRGNHIKENSFKYPGRGGFKKRKKNKGNVDNI